MHLVVNKKNAHIADDGFRKTENHECVLYIAGKAYDRNWRAVSDEFFLRELFNSFDKIYGFNGKFCGAIFNKALRTLSLFRDRTGLASLFYYCGKKIVISDRIFEIADLGVRLEEDYDVISTRLLYGSFLGSRTYYKNIKIVPVGKMISIDLTGNEKIVCTDPLFRAGVVDDRPLEDIALDTKNALEKAIVNIYNNADNEVVFTMTGGRDSRLLLGLAKNNGLKGRAFCVDNDGGFDEVKIARNLNEYLEMPTQYYYNKPNYYLEYMDDCLIKSEFMTTSHVWFEAFKDIDELHNTTVIMGLRGGETIQINNGLQKTSELLSLSGEEKRARILGTLLKSKQYLKEDVYNAMEEQARKYMKYLLSDYDFNKRGLTDYYLEGICYNNVEYILSMFPSLNGVSPYTDVSFLDIAYKYPERTDFIDWTFYKKIYDNVDIKLWDIDSTRSDNAKDKYYRERYADSKAVMEKVFDMFLEDNTIIDKAKTEKILNKRLCNGKYNLNKC